MRNQPNVSWTPTVVWGVVATAAVWLAWLFSSAAQTPKLAVNEDGEIVGVQNTIREALQGKRFWSQQLEHVSDELTRANGFSAQVEKWDAEMEEIDRELEALYQASPELRPPPELEAQETADHAEYDSAMASYIAYLEDEGAPRLERIRALIQRRLMPEK